MTTLQARRPLRAATLTIAALCAWPAHAADPNDAAELARASGCLSCHSQKEKIVGPAFASVAEKYAGQKDALAELTMSVQNGSVRKWGRIPMPAHASLPPADVKRLVEWVLKTPQ